MDDDDFTSKIWSCCNKPVDFGDYETKIMEPLNYLGRKPHRSLNILMKAANYWFQLSNDKFNLVNDLAMDFVNIILTMDDIVDDGRVRYGSKTPHVVFGVPSTLMSCEYANFKLLKRLNDISRMSGSDEVLNDYINRTIDAYKGQAVEIVWREVLECPTIEEYVMLTKSKTTFVFDFLFGLMQMFSDNKEDYSSFKVLLGNFIQLRNDYRNLFMPESQNKSEVFADDLTEGKFTFPLIYAIKQLKSQEVEEILRQRPTDLETKRKCVAILRDIGVQSYCKQVLNDLVERLSKEMKEHEENPLMELAIDILSDYNDWK